MMIVNVVVGSNGRVLENDKYEYNILYRKIKYYRYINIKNNRFKNYLKDIIFLI